MRPIDADELEKALENYSNNHGLINAFVEFLNVVDEVHTLDVRPIVRGHWTPRNAYLFRYKCSECGRNSEKYDYCPYCGADMRKEQNNECE